MRIEEFLLDVREIAKQYGIAEPMIVGGVPRDRTINRVHSNGLDKVALRDIDITTGDGNSTKLGLLISKKYPAAVYRTYNDGHTSVDILGIHLDFSSHFCIPGIEQELLRLGLNNPSSMEKELYSRDFTINALLEKLDFTDVFDITKKGIGDIHAGLIRCPINPDITIGVDARRILRAIKFAVKFDFTIEAGLKGAMMKYRQNITFLPPKFVSSKVDEIIQINPERGIDMLIEYKILPLVQLSKTVYDILIQRRKIVNAL